MSHQPPIFSIVLPTHNRARLLPRALQSVLHQTFENFELIIVDDASSDRTQEVVASFQDQRIVYIRQESNGGASAARNAGIMAAKGKYVTFLDDDDEYLPEFLAKMYRTFYAAPEQVGFAWCGVRKVQDTGEGELVLKEMLWRQDARNLEQRRDTPPPYFKVATSYGLTVRTECFGAVGLFEEALKGPEDTDFLIRLGERYDFAMVHEVLIKHYYHAAPQLTDPTSQKAISHELFIQKHREFLARYPRLWLGVHYKAAAIYYQLGDKTKARRMMLSMIQKQPLRWRSWKSLVCFELFGTEALGLRRKVAVWKTRSQPDQTGWKNLPD